MLPSISDLAKMRRELELSQKQLARLAGVSQSLIAKMERGRVDPSYRSVERIYRALTREYSLRRKSLTAKEIYSKKVVTVDADERVRDAARLMHEKGFSQLPVVSGGQIVGSITEDIITHLVAKGGDINHLMEKHIESVMEDAFPQVDENMGVETIAAILRSRKAILVVRRGETTGIITRADLLKTASRSGR